MCIDLFRAIQDEIKHFEIEKENMKSRLLLQIHDELILEVVAGEEEKISELVKREMGAAYPLKAPLDVNAGLGLTWHEAAH